MKGHQTKKKKPSATGKPPKPTVRLDVAPSTGDPKVLESLLSTPFPVFADKMGQMVFVDFNGQTLYINPEFERVTGVTLEDMRAPGFNFLHLYDKRSRPAVEEAFRRNFAGGEVESVEAVMLTKSGGKMDVIIAPKTVRLKTGIGVLGTITDVSNLKRLKADLERGQDRMTAYMDAMAVLVVVINADGVVVAVNRKAADVIGYTRDEMLGKNWFDEFIPAEYRASSWASFKSALSGETEPVSSQDKPALTRSGVNQMVRWFFTFVRNADGGITGRIGCGLDVSQERQLESSLQETEEKYRNLFETSPVGIFRTTPDGRVLIANPSLVKMLGYSSFEELAKRNLAKDGYHPDTPRKFFTEKIERDGEITGYESRWLKRDGTAMYARENAKAVRDSRGTTLFYEGTVEDVTRQKQNQEELYYRLNFERLIASISTRFVNIDARLVDQAIDHVLQEMGEFEGVGSCRIYQFSKNGKQITRTHGWSGAGDDVVASQKAKPIALIHPWTLKKLWRGEVVQLSRSTMLTQRRINAEAEYEYMERQGILSLLCVPFRMFGDEKGLLVLTSEKEQRTWSPDTISLLRVICEIFSTALDLKFTAAELEKERRLMNVFMDTIPDHIYFKDNQSKFIRVNKAFARDVGKGTHGDMVGLSDFDVFAEEHAKQALRDEQEVMRTGEAILGNEEKETWPDGSETWVSTTKMPLYDEKGEIIGTFGISRDVTARRRMEQERRELELKIQYAQKLESLSVLSGTIAHDFNNLLMGILGHTSLSLMEMTQESPAWENIKQIEATALCAAELTNQMLTYSGKSKVTLQPLNLTSLVREMAHLLEVSVTKRAKLNYNFNDTGELIEGDSAQLRQVVMNLIINASDAIGNKMGAVTVATGVMECDAAYLSRCLTGDDSRAGKYVYVEVSDNGCGMDESTMGRIFEPFFTTKSTGRGLGLAAVVGIVRAHRGGLKVESEVGTGTRFRVLLPVSSKKQQATERRAKDESAWKSTGTVLIVDDDEIVCKVTEKILTKFGFTVATAWTAGSAVQTARKCAGQVVAVLLDVTLPDAAGGEALKTIRQVVGDAPIILMSGFNVESATGDMKAGSFDGFLQKPFSGEILVNKLREVIEKK